MIIEHIYSVTLQGAHVIEHIYGDYRDHLQCDAAGYALNRMICEQCYGEHHGIAENTVKGTIHVTEDTVWHCRNLQHLLTHYG